MLCFSAYENEDRLLWDPHKLQDSEGGCASGSWPEKLFGHDPMSREAYWLLSAAFLVQSHSFGLLLL